MSWSLNIVRSLRGDPRHQEELRNGLEVKIHIWQSDFRISEKVQDFHGRVSKCSRRFRRVPLWGPHIHHDQEWPTGPFDQPSLVHVVNQWATRKWGVTALERGGYYLLKERGLPLFKEGVTTLVIKWLQLPCLYKRGERHTMGVQSLPHLLLTPAHQIGRAHV